MERPLRKSEERDEKRVEDEGEVGVERWRKKKKTVRPSRPTSFVDSSLPSRPHERTFSRWPFSLNPRIWCRPSAAGDTVIYRHPPVPFVTFLPSPFSPTISPFAENKAAKYISAVKERLLLKEELGHSDELHLVVRKAINLGPT